MARLRRDISEVLETLESDPWNGALGSGGAPIKLLEGGKVLFFPHFAFALTPDEKRFLRPSVADPKSKNVSFNPATGALKGAVRSDAETAAIKAMMQRYHQTMCGFADRLLPRYRGALRAGRTSFRPVEILGRRTSARKDDTRLHVDAFPSSPTAGERILRVFTNVNHEGKSRLWKLGAPFEDVARAYAPRVAPQAPGEAWLLKAVGATKTLRTAYDHLMLGLHDRMKADESYQRNVVQNVFSFPPGSTWIVFTDMTSHAALSGQHLFEQTFYLPVHAMDDPAKAPIAILERLAGRALAAPHAPMRHIRSAEGAKGHESASDQRAA